VFLEAKKDNLSEGNLTKFGNLVESVHGVNMPHSMSCLYVETLKNPNVEPNVESFDKVHVGAYNVDTSGQKIPPEIGNLDNLWSVETLS
jgi:hypothetical protein